MSLPKGVVKYTCPCGTEYLVALDDKTQDSAWLDVVREAAAQLGLEAIDGSQPSFVCSNCGRTHARRTPDAPGSDVPSSQA